MLRPLRHGLHSVRRRECFFGSARLPLSVIRFSVAQYAKRLYSCSCVLLEFVILRIYARRLFSECRKTIWRLLTSTPRLSRAPILSLAPGNRRTSSARKHGGPFL